MTFFETFTALMTTLIIAWWFKKYVEPKLDKYHEKITAHKEKIKKVFNR
jgi:p-aminobenzoyl-glutamate transporter AbgT